MANDEGDVSIVTVAVFALVLLATAVSVYTLRETRSLAERVEALRTQQPKIAIVRLSDITADMPKKPSEQDVGKLLDRLRRQSARLAAEGFVVLDDQAVFAAPEGMYARKP